MPRSVIVHYHLFKHAGSSIDAMLRDGLGERWSRFDPVEQYPLHVMPTSRLSRYLEEHQNLAAVSSHLARPPLPEIADTIIYPVVFLRDPILRIPSAYKFNEVQKKHNALANGGTPPEHETFEAFVERYLATGLTSVVGNYQTTVLSALQPDLATGLYAATRDDLKRALDFLRMLPVIGIVERFSESLEALRRWLGPIVPSVQWEDRRENISEPGLSTIEEIRERIGSRAYERLVQGNALDLELYQEALRLSETALQKR